MPMEKYLQHGVYNGLVNMEFTIFRNTHPLICFVQSHSLTSFC